MSSFRFIHTGDLHLDSPLHKSSALPGERGELVRNASRRAFDALVEHAIRAKVDAVLIAGDLWDGALQDASAALYVEDKVAELTTAGIRTAAILGNHDAESTVTGRVRALAELHIFPSDAPGSLEVGPAVIHGQSFSRPDVVDNIAASYPDAWPGRINVGLLHTALDGTRGHSPYAPCSLSELSARRYDYWALGHVHTRTVIQEAPAAGGGTVAWCGVLQGRDVGETGIKGALLVEVTQDGAALTPIDLPFVVWERLRVDMSARTDPLEAMAEAISGLRGRLPARVEHCMVRVELAGETALHDALAFRERELREHALAVIGETGKLTLERVRLATRRPALLEPPHLPAGFDDDLMEAARDPEVARGAMAAIAEVLSELDGDAKAALNRRNPAIARIDTADALSPLLEDAARRLVQRLASEGR